MCAWITNHVAFLKGNWIAYTQQRLWKLSSLYFVMSVLLTKIISDNARYFISEEFQEFTMQWSIQHITSSPRFPHGNAHAEKAVCVVKQIYQKGKWCQIGTISYWRQHPYQIKVGLFMMHLPMCSLVDNWKCTSQCFDVKSIWIHVLKMTGANFEVPSKYG